MAGFVGDNLHVPGSAVKIGEKLGKMQIIEEGLDGSERVICKGIQRARPDIKVNPILETADKK